MKNDTPITEIKSNLEKSHFEILKEAFDQIGLEYEQCNFPNVGDGTDTIRIPSIELGDLCFDVDFDFDKEGKFKGTDFAL